jgi:hypothetical protein
VETIPEPDECLYAVVSQITGQEKALSPRRNTQSNKILHPAQQAGVSFYPNPIGVNQKKLIMTLVTLPDQDVPVGKVSVENTLLVAIGKKSGKGKQQGFKLLWRKASEQGSRFLRSFNPITQIVASSERESSSFLQVSHRKRCANLPFQESVCTGPRLRSLAREKNALEFVCSSSTELFDNDICPDSIFTGKGNNTHSIASFMQNFTIRAIEKALAICDGLQKPRVIIAGIHSPPEWGKPHRSAKFLFQWRSPWEER